VLRLSKLYDIVLKKIKNKEYYELPEFRHELSKIRLNKEDVKELEKDLVFMGVFQRKTQRRIKRGRV
jgi:hypothetical protein